MMRTEYKLGLIVLGLVLLGVGYLLVFSSRSSVAPISGTPYVEIAQPSGFVNTEGITIGELIGKKIVLVDFMTYSCINCQRTFPYLRAWYEAYKDQGLEIVGIHTPEFAFEKDIDNVREAMRDFGITYPVVLDNNYATWRAYGNSYWPRKYLVDIHGHIVYDHIGEGAYEETEAKIRELLEERARVLGEETEIRADIRASEMPAAPNFAQSPETYFGSLRNERTAHGIALRGNIAGRTFDFPSSFSPNTLYHDGVWDITPEYAASASEGAAIAYRYYAKEVFIVADADRSVEVEVWQDGELLSKISCTNGTCEPDARGVDVSPMGVMRIDESRLYKVINNPAPGEHLLELRAREPGVRFYAFTFG